MHFLQALGLGHDMAWNSELQLPIERSRVVVPSRKPAMRAQLHRGKHRVDPLAPRGTDLSTSGTLLTRYGIEQRIGANTGSTTTCNRGNPRPAGR